MELKLVSTCSVGFTTPGWLRASSLVPTVIVGGLHAEHAAVVLVGHLVLPAPEAPPVPDVVLLLVRQGLAHDRVAADGGRGVAVVDTAVVD